MKIVGYLNVKNKLVLLGTLITKLKGTLYTSSITSTDTLNTNSVIIGGVKIQGSVVNGKIAYSNLSSKPSTFTPSTHTHDDVLYPKATMDSTFVNLTTDNTFATDTTPGDNIYFTFNDMRLSGTAAPGSNTALSRYDFKYLPVPITSIIVETESTVTIDPATFVDGSNIYLPIREVATDLIIIPFSSSSTTSTHFIFRIASLTNTTQRIIFPSGTNNSTCFFGRSNITALYIPPYAGMITFYGVRSVNGSTISSTWYCLSNKEVFNQSCYGFVSSGSNILFMDTSMINGPVNMVAYTRAVSRLYVSGVSGTALGFFGSGLNTAGDAILNTVDYINLTLIHAGSNISNTSSISGHGQCYATLQSPQYGFFAGGSTTPTPPTVTNRITVLNITSATLISNDRGTLVSSRFACAGVSGPTVYGFVSGGWTTAPVNTIDWFDITVQSGSTTSSGTLTVARYGHCGLSGPLHGFFCGGTNSSNARSNVIDRINLTSTSVTCQDRGDLTVATHLPTGVSGQQYGFIMGGVNSSGTLSSNIDYIDITTTSINASSRGTTSLVLGGCGSVTN